MARTKPTTQILIADGHPIFREAITRLIMQESGLNVVGYSENGKQILQLIKQKKPNIILIDPVLSKKSGVAILNSIKESNSKIKAIVLSDSIIREEMADFFESGAHGVVAKESPSSVLFDSIKTVMAGKYWIGHKSASRPGDRVIRFKKSVKSSDTDNYGLTPREIDVLKTVVSGYTNKEIARKLHISEQTVKHHITNIFDKLGVYNRLELTLFVFHHGLVEN